MIKLLWIGCVCLSVSVHSNEIPPLYAAIANVYRIPPGILYAIALTESGYRHQKKFNPWPWTLNVRGKGLRFSTRNEAQQALQAAQAKHIDVDVGVMQINTRWHAHRVFRVTQLLDPRVNIKTGAHILREQYQQQNDWWLAVGRYHSPHNKTRAEAYAQKVRQHYNTIRF